jgi:hypothetical protein
VLNQIDADWKADNYAFQDLISEVVRSLPFQSRRGEAVTPKPKPVQKDVASR